MRAFFGTTRLPSALTAILARRKQRTLFDTSLPGICVLNYTWEFYFYEKIIIDRVC